MKNFLVGVLFVYTNLIFCQVQVLENLGRSGQEKQQLQHPFEKRAAWEEGKNFKKGPCFEGPDKKTIPLVTLICSGDLEAIKIEYRKLCQRVGASVGCLKIQNRRVTTVFGDKKRRTLLHWAAFYGFLPIVEFLVQNDAEIDFADDEGWTPLHYAAVQDHVNVVRYLVQKRVDTKLCTKEDKRVWDLPLSREAWRALEGN